MNLSPLYITVSRNVVSIALSLTMSVSADGVFDLDSVQCFLTEPLLTKIKDLLCDLKQDRGFESYDSRQLLFSFRNGRDQMNSVPLRFNEQMAP